MNITISDISEQQQQQVAKILNVDVADLQQLANESKGSIELSAEDHQKMNLCMSCEDFSQLYNEAVDYVKEHFSVLPKRMTKQIWKDFYNHVHDSATAIYENAYKLKLCTRLIDSGVNHFYAIKEYNTFLLLLDGRDTFVNKMIKRVDMNLVNGSLCNTLGYITAYDGRELLDSLATLRKHLIEAQQSFEYCDKMAQAYDKFYGYYQKAYLNDKICEYINNRLADFSVK